MRRLTLLLLACFVLALLAVTVPRAPPTFQLDAMTEFRPGAPRSVLVGFSCQSVYASNGASVCHRYGDGMTRAIYVTLENDTIRTVSMSFYGARIAELEQRFGRASSRSGNHRLVKLCYEDGHARAIVLIRPFGTLPVSTYLSLVPDNIRLC